MATSTITTTTSRTSSATLTSQQGGQPSMIITASSSSSSPSCPQCGTHVQVEHASSAEEAQERITALEAQVRVLNEKAAAAADKLADYEDEVRFLRSSQQTPTQQNSRSPESARSNNGFLPGAVPYDGSNANTTVHPATPAPLPQQQPPPQPQVQTHSRLSSLTSLIGGRRTPSAATATTTVSHPNTPGLAPPNYSQQQQLSANPSTSTAGPPGSSDQQQQQQQRQNSSQTSSSPTDNTAAIAAATATLNQQLQQERKLREAAERSLTESQYELEELTAQLFGQANEMVATERRRCAKLEQKLEVMQLRDEEKRERLERLEQAVERVDRVRAMVDKVT